MGGAPDWAGRHPYGGPNAPGPASDTNQLCLVSMWTGVAGIVLSILSFVSLPLGLAAVVTGFIGLTQLRHQPSKGRGNAVAGICCGVAALIMPIVIMVGFGLTAG